MALTDIALCLLADVKTELGITGSASDTKLERMIHSVSEFFASYCNRTFYYEEDITETFNGYGTPFIQLARSPIVSIDSITYDGSTVSSDEYEIHTAASGLVRHVSSWIWTTRATSDIAQDPRPGFERKLYEATYTAGWVTASQKALDPSLPARDLPYDLEDAAIQVVAARFRAEGRDTGVKSENLGEYNVSYRSAPMSKDQFAVLYSFAAEILKRYYRPAFT